MLDDQHVSVAKRVQNPQLLAIQRFLPLTMPMLIYTCLFMEKYPKLGPFR